MKLDQTLQQIYQGFTATISNGCGCIDFRIQEPRKNGSTQAGTLTSIITPVSGMKLPLASTPVILSGSMVHFHAVVMMTGLLTVLD
jgi:hypothetical protein